ncbi:MAG: protein kinase [Minicystis sp.]
MSAPAMDPSGDRGLAAETLLDEKFRIKRLLGRGGMGAVYEIEHELTRHRRALKLLHAAFQSRGEVVTRFLREASAAGRIDNPHIIETFDAGSLSTGEPYVVMELLAGRTLADLLVERKRLDLPEICALLAQACEGVQAAHDAGIVHRDLKPENLFVVTRDGKPFVKILDFGISKFDAQLTDGAKMTREGAALGTPLYMPPEQVRGAIDLDARADVYALGVILYECAAGELPYQASSLAHLALLIHEGKPIPLATHRPDLPRAFHALVARAMATNPEERVPSARALGESLRRLGAESPRVPDELAATALGPAAPEPAATPSAPIVARPAVVVGESAAPVTTSAPSRSAVGNEATIAVEAVQTGKPAAKRALLPWAIPIGLCLVVVALFAAKGRSGGEPSTAEAHVDPVDSVNHVTTTLPTVVPAPLVSAAPSLSAAVPAPSLSSSALAAPSTSALAKPTASAASLRPTSSSGTRAQQKHLAEENPIP